MQKPEKLFFFASIVIVILFVLTGCASKQGGRVSVILDNSGSMLQNDPQFLTKEVVTNFMVGFGAKSRLAMILFHQEAKLVKPLTDLTGLVARANFLKSLDQVNYKGLLSDSPAAIERAIYELKLNGRINARKVIILLTDGIVDTGDKARDLVKAKWLKESLAQECKSVLYVRDLGLFL